MKKRYFLYAITWNTQEQHNYIYPHKIYNNLSSAKNAKVIKDYKSEKLNNLVWLIVPIETAFDKTSKIKYMLINGQWTTEKNEKIENIFYKWRENDGNLTPLSGAKK